ncbi:MAG: peptide ABC transporter substrate-binding protein [Anaerolineaceae bacterium]|nr:peptide ABC transporter substrate-binding protein [Anaerolineaceae bacterium]
MDNKLSRRNFLRVVAGSTAGAIAVSAAPIALAAPAKQAEVTGPPNLDDLVGVPAAERVPVNPRVITPYEETGQYGGTWRRAFKGISDRWGPTKLNEEMAIEWDAPTPEDVGLTANFISEWVQNDDATEFTFTLREGLKWSDGDDFTTEDVQFWYDYMYLGELGNKQDYYTLGGVDMELEVVDDLTWTVRFPSPNPLLPIFIAKSTGGMTAGPTMAGPSHYLTRFIPDHENADQAAIDAAMEANGVTSWQELFGTAGDLQGPIAFWFRNPELPVVNAWKSSNLPTEDPHIMERNPFYHAVDPDGQQLPYIDRIEHALFDDNAVFDLWIAQGRIDMQSRHVDSANFTFYKENEEAGNYRVMLWRNASTNALHPNINNADPVLAELFDTAQFREALSIAINRVEINELVYSGLFEPRQASPVTGSPQYDPEFESRWTEYDPDRANALLDELGLEMGSDGFRLRPDGEPLVFRILHRETTGTPGADEMQLVEDYWRAVGLNVSQDVVERSLYEERTENGDVDVGMWSVDRSSIVMADPGRYIGTTDDGPWAPLYGHWWTPGSPLKKVEPPADHPIREIWRLWEEARAEPDEAQRNAIFQQLLDIHKEHPYQIGTVGESPRINIVANNMANFVEGYIADDTLRDVGLINPVQFFFRS